MRFIDLIRTSLGNLWRRKLRTSLTILGVLIGVASIVVMLSIGIGQKEYLLQSIAGSADLTSIRVYDESGGFHGGPSSSPNVKKLDDKALREIAALEHVDFVSPVLDIFILCFKGPYEGYINIQAINRLMLEDMKLSYSSGGFPEEITAGKLPLVVGSEIGNNFYNPKADNSRNYQMWSEGQQNEGPVNMYEEPVFAVFDTDAYWAAKGGNGKAPKKYMLQADGVIARDAKNPWRYGNSAFTEIEALKEHLKRVYGSKAWPNQPKTKTGRSTGQIVYSSIYVRSSDIKHTTELMVQIKALGYRADSAVEYIKQMQDQAQRSQMLLGGIGAISLLVAAIGIANTMMMSIYERTREIGIFKVLGCSLSNIRSLFLLEAAFIGLIGGMAGDILSYILSFIINNVSKGGSGGEGLGMGMMGMMSEGGGGRMSIIPVWLYGAALVFGTLIGMISGLMPALRAMKLSALEAIRTQ